MKIVLATPLYPPDIGGPATYAKILFEKLPERGIEVTLVKFSEMRRLPKGIRHLAYGWRVWRALADADLALALDPVSVGLPVCIAAWLARKPFVVKIVGDYAWEQGRQRFGIAATLDAFVQEQHVPFFVWFLRRIQTSVTQRARRIIVPSEYLRNIIVVWGVPVEKITVVYNAVPVETFGTVPAPVAALPRPLMATAGRLVPWKHVDGVIDAAALLRHGYEGRVRIDVSLAIIGDGPERAALTHRACEKLPNQAVFTGQLSHAATLAAIQLADIFVLNSSYEGLSHLLIEAAALGVPIVATRVGGNPEVIADGENGLLVPAGDTGALARACERVLSDGTLRARLSARAKESATRFSVEVMLQRTSDVLMHMDIGCPNR